MGMISLLKKKTGFQGSGERREVVISMKTDKTSYKTHQKPPLSMAKFTDWAFLTINHEMVVS